MSSKGKIFVISGPSGSGKTTLAGKLLKDAQLKNKLTRSISFTTRPKRSIEKEGKDYFFLNESRFRAGRDKKKILEWTRYLGYYYGTPKHFVEQRVKAGKSVVLCLDVKGACRVKKLYPDTAVTIFVLPPSVKELHHRIKGRCLTAHEEIKKRLSLVDKELAAAKRYDYRILNRDLEVTVKKLKGILIREIKQTR